MMEIFAVHEVVLALDLIKSVMDQLIVIMERMKKIAVRININMFSMCIHVILITIKYVNT